LQSDALEAVLRESRSAYLLPAERRQFNRSRDRCALAFFADGALDSDVGELHAATRAQHAVQLGEDGVLVGMRSITPLEMTTSIDALSNGAIRLAVDEADVRCAELVRWRAGRASSIAGVMSMPVTEAFHADHLGGDETVHAGTDPGRHVLAGGEGSE